MLPVRSCAGKLAGRICFHGVKKCFIHKFIKMKEGAIALISCMCQWFVLKLIPFFLGASL